MKFKQYINESYEPDIFYKLDNIRNKEKFLKDCISKSYSVDLDELDCNVSFNRKKTKKSLNDIFKIVKDSNFIHYIFIERNTVFGNEKPHLQAGLRTSEQSSGIDYFIFIYIKYDKLNYFIKKYRLKNM